MENHWARWATIIACLGALQACSATATVRDAEIVLKDGRVCFSAATKDQSSIDGVHIQALSVSGPRGAPDSGGKPPLMWAFWVKKGQALLSLKKETCIAYGVLPPKSEQTVMPKDLQENAVYSVSLNGRPPLEGGVLGYRAEFCVSVNDKGEVERLVVVPWDEKAQKWRYDLCTQAAHK